MKHLSLFVAALLGFTISGLAQYTMTVESAPAVAAANQTVYRFYVDMQSADDELSAVYANAASNLVVDAPDGVFNSAFNSSWNASGINPLFVATVPELADDTYATIGLDGPASAADLDGTEADPQGIETPADPFTQFFLNDGETSLSLETNIGASWFVIPGTINARPLDSDLKVLIMQVTTAGEISGQMNFQLFPGGDQTSAQSYEVVFSGAGTFGGELFQEVIGCMDEAACNYDPDANLEPLGTCEYPEDISADACDCDGNVEDACGVCGGDNSSCTGCGSDLACNYDPNAIVLDFSSDYCVYPGDACDDGNASTENDTLNDDCECVGTAIPVLGCTNPDACNYDAAANTDDGSCAFPGDACGDGLVYNEDCDCVVDAIVENGLSFGMFPNPTSGELTLQVEGVLADANVQVLDAAGRIAWNKESLQIQGNFMLDLSGLSDGLYTVVIQSDGLSAVKRLAIQR